MKKETENKKTFLRRLGDKVREESGIFFGEPMVRWHGKKRLIIEGAEKIGFFSAERILVLLSGQSLTVCGKGLMCLSFQNQI